MKKFFHFDELNTNYKQEIIAGITTFITMAYIIVVNPKILEAAGIPFGPSLVATALTAAIGTLLIGIYAKRPFAIAPYMGENAFIAYTVVKILGYSWQTALGAIFISGILFIILTLTKVRVWLAKAIPESLKISFAVGIGLFLIFIGLNESGIIQLGTPGAPVRIGNVRSFEVILSILGFLLITILMMKKINGSILIGIIVVTFISVISGLIQIPEKIFTLPLSLEPTFFKLDIVGALSWGFFSVILTIFILDFLDTLGTLIGLGYKADLIDKEGDFPEIEKPMLCDAISTCIAALLGTTTAGIYIESAAGIQAGGRSGFTAVIVALLFLLSIFLDPLIEIVPSYAYGPALIVVGILMMSPVGKINFEDMSEFIPAMTVIFLMSFSFNIGIGMTAGFVIYPLLKIFDGKVREIKSGMWILFIFSVLFYIFYPY
ncbi:MAG: NCS2 family permease [Ignavibacteria bacterium]|jgi:AGZA family xanthine/uracil permease-like MFS transporter|nr:NCS2 family permease [Ignavibacteria bacterium]MDH7528122.1 NCS2 family permease [Ignavibacteria bacterium]